MFIFLMTISFFLLFFFFLFFYYFVLVGGFLDWLFFDFLFVFDFCSLLFFFILLIVVMSVFLFTNYYLSMDINFTYFFFVLLVFIGSMIFLNFSKSLLYLLLSWDLLGISSYFLVLFYNNWDSNIGSMNVALTNRLGDYFFFFMLSYFFCSCFYFKSLVYLCWFFFIFVFLTAFTKSAQFPFSSWLPKAMSAPTPVSALVHSSTLVTAGLILMMNFNVIIMSSNLSFLLSFFGLMTMFFSSFMALLEQDMKKVVALSTLSQMGFSCLILGFCMNFFCLFHLLSHALFKSCLFIQLGYIISKSFGLQDGRYYSNLSFSPFLIQFQMLVTLFCLCGLFFTSGLVSKDFVLEYFFSLNLSFFFFFFFLVIVFFTFFYSYRLWMSLFSISMTPLNFSVNSFFINFVSLFLVSFSVCFVWFINKNFIFFPSIFLYVSVLVPLFYFFVFFFLFYFSFFFIMSFLNYSFLVDYYAKIISFLLFNFKFFDFFLNNFLLSFFFFFKGFSYDFNKFFFSFNIVLFLWIFLVFFFLF